MWRMRGLGTPDIRLVRQHFPVQRPIILMASRPFGCPAPMWAMLRWLPCVMGRLAEERCSPCGACSKLLVLDPAAVPISLPCGLAAGSGDGSTLAAASCRAKGDYYSQSTGVD